MIIRRIYATLTRGSDYINLPQGALAKSQLFSMSMLPFIFSGLGIRGSTCYQSNMHLLFLATRKLRSWSPCPWEQERL